MTPLTDTELSELRDRAESGLMFSSHEVMRLIEEVERLRPFRNLVPLPGTGTLP